MITVEAQLFYDKLLEAVSQLGWKFLDLRMAKVSVKQKKVVIQRANNCCEYCRSQARFATQ